VQMVLRKGGRGMWFGEGRICKGEQVDLESGII